MNSSADGQPTMMSCREAASALYDFLDGRLDGATQSAVEGHVAQCKACAPHYEFSRRVLAQVATSLPLANDTGAIRNRIVEALKAEGYAAQR